MVRRSFAACASIRSWNRPRVSIERADLHRPLYPRDADGIVFLRSAADEEAESAADVPSGAVARLEIAEDVQLVGSEL
jgi:hypothetical protein